MKQENIDELMKKINRRCKLPKNWEKFIKETSEKHNIIIKDRVEKKLYCTHCQNYFIDKSIKVGDFINCPICDMNLQVCGANYYKKSFTQPIVLAQRINKQVIIRIFEIYTYFDSDGSKKKKRSCVEYARIIPGIGKFLGDNVYINMFGHFCIYHNFKKLQWYSYRGQKFLTHYPTYPYNKKRLIKGTNMEYAPIDEFMRKFAYCGYNFLDTLELAAYGSFELLWNMKLYNLCFYSKALNKTGSFYKRFGVPKNFLKFMQDNDVTYKELMILKLFQKADKNLLQKFRNENINNLRFLIKNNLLEEYYQFNLDSNSYYNIRLLREISKYVPIRKLINYPKGLKNLNIYKDYLEMSKKLALNYRTKKDLFPRNLISRHDKLQTKIKIDEDKNKQFAAYLRYLKLSKYTYSDNKYIIFPAPSIDSMKDEGRQQGNCVGYIYVNPYINGETEIFFIRELENVCKSFITLEYKKGKIVQKELPHHSTDFKDEQINFIEKWLGFRSFIDNKEKIEKQIKIKKYNIKNMVA